MSETHGKPSDPQEPKTPMWLPALGAVLFLMVGIVWGLQPSKAESTGSTTAASADAGAPPTH